MGSRRIKGSVIGNFSEASSSLATGVWTGQEAYTYQKSGTWQAPPTFSLASSAGTVNEGASVTFTLTTTGIPNGTLIPWNVSGANVTINDVSPLTGNFVVVNGTGSVSFTANSDILTEGSEYLLFNTVGLTSNVTINDTSLTPGVGDAQWPYVTALLQNNGVDGGQNSVVLSGTSVPPSTSDASTNNFNIAIAGDVKPNRFNPNQDGYYSNYFDGGGNYLTMPGSVAALNLTGDFTVECWAHATATTNAVDQVFNYGNYIFMLYHNGTTWTVEVGSGSSNYFTLTGTASLNSWHHFAITRNANTYTFWIDGVSASTTSDSNAPATSSATLYIGRGGAGNSQNFTGYISNFRIVKGTSLYTSTFTPSTTSLTAITGTSLLTCQSAYFKDNSTNAFTITPTGTPTVSYNIPFAQPTTVNVPSYYSTIFDGSSSYLTVPNNAALTSMNGSLFTAEAWFYSQSTSNGAILGCSTYNSAGYIIFQLSGVLYAYINGGGSVITGPTITQNAWNHVALVYDGTNTKLYLNGTSVGTPVAVSPANVSSNPFVIGGITSGTGWNSSLYFTGHISNVRVVKGVAVYTGNFTPPTSPLAATQSSGTNITAITGTATSLLTCQNSTLIDNSTNAFTISSSGAAVPVTGTPFTQSYTQQTVSNYGSGYFDGTGDYLSIPTNSALNFGSGDFTIEAWINPANLSADWFVISASGSGGLFFGNKVPGGFGYGRSAVAWDYNAGTITPNVWQHVALTRSGTSIRIFINGIQQGTTQTSSQAYDVGATSTTIGSQGANLYFPGYISNLRVLKGTALYTSNFAPPASPLTAVTNTQLLTLQYNGATNDSGFMDQGPNDFVVTRNGNPTQGSFAPFGSNWSNYFNGTTDWFTTPSSDVFTFGTGDFTVEAWVNIPALPSPYHVLGGTYYTSSSDAYWSFSINSSGYPTFNGRFTTLVTGTSAVSINTWTHIAISRQSGTNRVFVNGVLSGTSTTSMNFSGVNTMTVGYAGNAGNFTGYISNFRIVKGTALYTTTFTPSTAPLTAVTNTSLLTCQSPSFQDNSANSFALTISGTPKVQRSSPFTNYIQTPQTYSTKFDGSVNDYIDVASNAVLSYGTGDFEISFWYYATSASGYLFDQRSAQPQVAPVMYYDSGSIVYYNNGGGFTATDPSKNTWHYLTLSRVSGITRLFVDGAQLGSNYTDSSNYGTLPLRLGCRFTTTSDIPYSGYISNFRIIKGTGVTSQTVPTSPLTAISGTSLLTCQNSTLIDNSTNALTITTGGSPKPKTVNPLGYTTGSPQVYSPATYGGSMYFDGTGDYLEMSSSTEFAFGTRDFTVEAWIYPLAYGGSTVGTAIFGTTGGGSTGYSLNLGESQDRMRILSNASGTWADNLVVSTGGGAPLNTWSHIAWVRNGNSMTIYKNGTSVATMTGVSAYNFTSPANKGFVGFWWDGSSTRYFAGNISNLRVVKGTAVYTSNFVPPAAPATAITNTTLLLNGTNAGIYDSSMQNVFETVGNAQLAPLNPYAGTYYSNYFNGSSYLTAPSNAAFGFGTGDFTVEGWFYFTGTISTYQRPWWFGDDNDNLEINGSVLKVGGASQGTLITGGTTILPNTWYHIALTRASGSYKLWLNGSQQGSTATNSYNSSARTFTSMATSGGSSPSTGYISNLRIVKGTALYTTTFTPSTTPLTAISGTSLLTCQSNKFIDNSTNAFTITTSGTPSVQISNPFANNTGKSIYFDGSGDYLNIPNTQLVNFGAGDYTVEAWVYPTAISGDQYVFSFQVSGVHWSINIYQSNWRVGYNLSATGISATSALNTWTHVAVCKSSGTQRFYINGSLASSVADTNTITPDGAVYVGAYSVTPANYWAGYIDDLRITRGYARYTSSFTPPTTTLTGQ